MNNVTYALRSLRRAPGFTAVAILTLSLGIGANTAIFSVVNAMLIEPLPYRNPSQLAFVWCDLSSAGYPRAPLSGPELKDLRDRTTRFTDFGAVWATSAALTGDGDPEQLRTGLVTTNFFSLLGANAALGRTFAAEDESRDAPRAVLLSWPLWQRRYGADRGIVGRQIQVSGRSATVVGVMPEDFRLLMPPDAGVPDNLEAFQLLDPEVPLRAPRGQKYLRVVGRMKPGVTLDEGRRDIDNVARTISKEFPEYGAAGRQFTTVGLQADGVRPIRPMLLALFGGVAILLLIACVNVASLLVARAAARARDTVVRMSLGAGSMRLTRQCLVEGTVLTMLGAVAGIVVGHWGLRGLLALRPDSLARLGAARINWTVLLFTVAITVIWGILLSLAPVAEVLRTNLRDALQEGRRVGGSIQHRLRSALVVAQIALSVVLLVGAALMFRTFTAVQRIDPGFHADRVLTFKVSLPGERYQNRDQFNAFARQLQTQIAALPQVTGVGSISHMPYDNVPNWGGPYIVERGADDSRAPFADNRAVSPGFFESVGAKLVEGRFFTEADDGRGPPVLIVDDQLARRAWPGESAIGREIAIDPFASGHAAQWATVVGVVGHVRHRSLLENLGDQIFISQRQIQRNPLGYAIRTTGDPDALAPVVRRMVHDLDPQLPVFDMRPLSSYVASARSAQRFTTILAVTFAAVAIALASVGVYGVIAYATTRRRYEFGVRLALGAQSREVVTLVLREGVVLAVSGLSLGLLGAALGARALRSQLYGVAATDAASYAVAAVAMVLVALAACWLPARRASSISPVEAMRTE